MSFDTGNWMNSKILMKIGRNLKENERLCYPNAPLQIIFSLNTHQFI